MNNQPESEVNEQGAGLCKEHYGAWYRLIHPFQTKCTTCDKNMTDMSKSRACPQPDIIQKYLRENTDFSGEITNNNRVCYACYKSHLVTIKLLNSTVHSTDVDLHILIANIQLDIPVVSDAHTLDDYTSNTLAIEVGEALLKQTALLLPSIYEKFCDKPKEITRLRGIIINQDNQSLVSVKKLLRQDAAHPQNIEDIDIEKHISELDTDIWKATCLFN